MTEFVIQTIRLGGKLYRKAVHANPITSTIRKSAPNDPVKPGDKTQLPSAPLATLCQGKDRISLSP